MPYFSFRIGDVMPGPLRKVNGEWQRDDGSVLYVVRVQGLTRVGVWARSRDSAWNEFVDKMFPRGEGGARRRMPPPRDECIVREADDDEVMLFLRKGGTTKNLTDLRLFDDEAFTRGSQKKSVTVPRSSVRRSRSSAAPTADPVLEARLRAAKRRQK